MLKYSRKRCVGHVARMGDRIGAYRASVGKLEGKKYLEDLGVDGRVTLKSVIKKWNGNARTGLI
jgi:hypothetical protein